MYLTKMLVYEYMPKGSLGDMLHSSKGGLLDWPTRYKIVVDAAEGLSYLHHDCVPPIVHRDVKSNNILLDGEFGARVADFGVAKAVEAIGKGPKSMSVIAGSCGYIAPGSFIPCFCSSFVRHTFLPCPLFKLFLSSILVMQMMSMVGSSVPNCCFIA